MAVWSQDNNCSHPWILRPLYKGTVLRPATNDATPLHMFLLHFNITCTYKTIPAITAGLKIQEAFVCPNQSMQSHCGL